MRESSGSIALDDGVLDDMQADRLGRIAPLAGHRGRTPRLALAEAAFCIL
jgi:hypothetical protein